MKAIIPFKLNNPKSRLSSILSLEERRKLAELMLEDVLDVVLRFIDNVIVLVPKNIHLSLDVKVVEDRRDLNDAINSRIEKDTAIIMSDLPLLNDRVLKDFLNRDGDIIIAPGRRGGTNMLLIRDERFRVSYHYGSFLKHVEIAKKLGLKVEIFDSFYASIDIDNEQDLLELLIHGKGKKSYDFLLSIGFKLDLSNKEPKLIRS